MLKNEGAEDDAKAGTKVTPKSKVKGKPKQQAKQVMEKHKHNLITILKTSNATPILRYGGIGYMCSYCLKEFPDPKDLKTHCLENHKDSGKAMMSLNKRENLVEYTAKVDITDLVCEICSKEIDSLDNLFVHLKEIHQLVIHDVPNHIIPFKFYGDKFDCYICSSWFDNFKPLLEHMHSHYRNFVCTVCDKGFVNRAAWRTHERRHIVGTFPCRFCDSVFDTLARRVSHETITHLNAARLVCGYCHERFEYIYHKNEHMVKEHGVKPKSFQCKSCNGLFSTQAQLFRHVKKRHLLLRNHKCTECEKAFYSASDLKNHMIKHTKERNFQCLICMKAFTRRRVLIIHMRKHSDDRRYTCELCGQAFLQNCSLKMHMRNIHGQTEKVNPKLTN